MPEGLLAGYTILEAADPLTEFAGLMLAGLGADVFLIEPPGGASTRRRRPFAPGVGGGRESIPFLARNLGKRSLVLDLDEGSDRELLKTLSARADGILDSERSPFHEVLRDSPAPRATVTGAETIGESALVAFAAGGGLSSSGWPHQPPTNAPSNFGLDASAIYAAASLLVGMFARSRGAGPTDFDINAVHAAIAASTPWTRPLHSYGMTAAGQGAGSARMGAGPYPVLKTSDGYIRVLTGTPRQWSAWITLLGNPPALTTPDWETPAFRAANFDAMVAVAAEIVATRTTADLFREGQARGLTITPVLDVPGFLEDAHVNFREFFAHLTDPDVGAVRVARPAYRLDGASPPQPGPAPALDDGRDVAMALLGHSAATSAAAAAPLRAATLHREERGAGPLHGLRILECGVGAVVPEAASFLALLGAEVIKVESRKHVDFLRQVGLNGVGDHNNAPTFNQMNLGVLSVAVDMTTAEGQELVKRLVPLCDAVVENNRGPVMAKWGLDYESVRALRQDIVYLSSQGLGEGPYGGYQTYGPNLQAFSGVLSLWAHPDDPYPGGSTLNHPDHVAGKQALAPLIAALMRRDRTGQGAFLDCTQFEAAAALIGDKFLQHQLLPGTVEPMGNASHDVAPHGVYPCDGDDTWCALAVEDDGQWARLVAVMGEAWASAADLATVEGRLARRAELDERLAAWTRTMPAGQLETMLRATSIPASKVRIGDDLAADNSAHESGFFACVPHPTAGARWYTGLPLRSGEGAAVAIRRAPLLGEHDEYVFGQLLGMEPSEMSRLAACGVIGY